LRLVKTCELPADRNYLFCSFPHGILPYGLSVNVGTNSNNFNKLYPGIRTHMITLSLSFSVPFFREIILSQGCCSASEKSLKYILNGPPGSACVLLVGGIAEALRSFPHDYRLVLKNRKGFIRIALQTGTPLVPVFSFGETNSYSHVSSGWCRWLEEKLYTAYGVPLVIISGRGFLQKFFGLLPKQTNITTVVGKPIPLPKIDDPEEQDIQKYHSIFVSNLQDLFDKHKQKYDSNGNNAILKVE